MLCPVILAGGGGTRLWPLSREHYPKQFLKLFGENTLLQNTLLRLSGISDKFEVSNPLIICNENHRFLVAEQTVECELDLSGIILEPEGRNTAPALTVACNKLVQEHDDPVVLMMPADHMIKDVPAFQRAIANGYENAREGYLVTFGIEPDKPETGYGYIHYGDLIQQQTSHSIHQLKGFTEKPSLDLAEEYLAA